MTTPTLTIVEHVQILSGYRLTVHVPDTDPAVLAPIAGDTIAETTPVESQVVDPETGAETTVTVEQPTGASLHKTEWDAETTDEYRREQTRLLIEHALAAAAVPDPAPEPITPPGTEL